MATKDPSTKAIANAITTFFSGEDDIKIVILFGSFAAGRQTERSDVDIAVAGTQPLSLDRRIDLANQLSSVLKREVDLIDLGAVSGPILKETLTKGTVLKKTDNGIFAALMRKLWYHQADVQRYTDFILAERRKRFLNG